MANVKGFGNKQWHNAVPNNMKVAIPLDMEENELTELRNKLENAGMNYYGYILQEQDKNTIKISIPQKEIDDFCLISGIENPALEMLNSNPAVEESKKNKMPVGNVNYRELNPAMKINCDLETALLAERRMENQNRPVSMAIWSLSGERATISTDRNNYQALSAIVEEIQKSKENRPKEAEKEIELPEPAPKQTSVVYSEMADEDVRKLAEIMMNNVCPSARNDLQKLSMYGEPPEINSPFFDNKTVIDFRKGIDVSEKMGKELFEQQGSFFSSHGIHIASVEEDFFVVAENGKNYDVSYSRLGVAVEENLKEDFKNDKRFHSNSHISEKEDKDVGLLYDSYRKIDTTDERIISKDEQKQGIAIAERFILADETGLDIFKDKDKIAFALALSHIGVREKFTDYSLDVDYKRTLPESVVNEIVKNAVEYKELILNSEAGKEISAEFQNALEGKNEDVYNKIYEAYGAIEDYAGYYLKIAKQINTELLMQDFSAETREGKALNSFALAYALADAGEIEFTGDRIVEKPEPEKEKQETPTPSVEETKDEPEKTNVPEPAPEKEEEEPKKTSRRKKEEIKDFGNYIGGAKKENFSGMFSINEKWSDKERQENIKKNNIWQFSKKDHTEMRDKGIPVEVIYYINKIKNSLDTKPCSKAPEEQERYVDFVNKVKNICEEAVKDKSFKNLDDTKAVLAEIKAKIVREAEYTRPNPYVTRKFANAVNKTYNLKEEAVKRNFLVNPEQKLENDINKRFVIISDETNRKYNNRTGFSVLDRKAHTRTDNIPTYEEAMQICRDTIENDKKDRKTSLKPPQLVHIERNGEQYRSEGEKITGNDIMERFRLYGGEFGNWESQQLRQGNLDMLYDSMKDLAKLLNIKATDVGLDGSLAIAFGARGSGNALAHYEPQKHVINLTRERGAGSLAHEYAHALDRYLNEKLGLNGTFASENSRSENNPMGKVMDIIRYKRDEDGQITGRTEYYENACKLAGSYTKTGNGYWNEPTEMLARAFACYVTDKLAETGMKNDYLSGHSDFNVMTAPQGEERKKINQAIDKMIEEIKEMGLMQEPVTEKTSNLHIYTAGDYGELQHIRLQGNMTKTDECTLDGKNYLVMQSDYTDNLILTDEDGVVYDDNISVNYSQYNSLDILVEDSICTNTAKAIEKDTGVSEKEAFTALKSLYEEGTYDFDDMHRYCSQITDKYSGDDIDVTYVSESFVSEINSAVADIINKKEQVAETETPYMPELD